jgi:hypothetical protein
MTAIALKATARFPVGTSVAAYPRSAWTGVSTDNPSGAPSGSPAETQTVQADGTLTFSALVDGTRYFAYANVGGEHRIVGFTPNAGNVSSGGAAAGRVLALDASSPVGLTALGADDSAVPTLSGGKIVAGTVPGQWRLTKAGLLVRDAVHSVHMTTGAGKGTGTWLTGLCLKVLAPTTYLLLQMYDVAGATGCILYKRVAGVDTQLAALGSSSLAAGQEAWLMAHQIGNRVRFAYSSTDPFSAFGPTFTASPVEYTLAGADATQFGAGVDGGVGLAAVAPSAGFAWSAWRVQAIDAA